MLFFSFFSRLPIGKKGVTEHKKATHYYYFYYGGGRRPVAAIAIVSALVVCD